jgi:two-component system LytT family response regulator
LHFLGKPLEIAGLGIYDFPSVLPVGAAAMPLTVFVTAYDKHAIRAFEANALNYLLKPFSDERWEATLARAKTRHYELSLRELGRSVFSMLATRSQEGRYLDRRW